MAVIEFSRNIKTLFAIDILNILFVYRLSPFPFPLLAIFSPFPQTEGLITG